MSRNELEECLSGLRVQLKLKVVTMNGIEFQDRPILLAMGIDRAGPKYVLGLRVT